MLYLYKKVLVIYIFSNLKRIIYKELENELENENQLQKIEKSTKKIIFKMHRIIMLQYKIYLIITI